MAGVLAGFTYLFFYVVLTGASRARKRYSA
jgi:hypothetical protein